ncbi:e3 ubiquitin-protein ligase rnf213 [Anaeramoeba ignava]|uniref:E3 ubiquitin-protein ligase rnf213 n=1 Tax=Anaeramoeba ignava TaxID=1746090 RepID=A0A9Q0LTJ0_ANAIG|nr:e3 ubiquitin-protein ligase rnf213 [Anaeramoeba ignava]
MGKHIKYSKIENLLNFLKIQFLKSTNLTDQENTYLHIELSLSSIQETSYLIWQLLIWGSIEITKNKSNINYNSWVFDESFHLYIEIPSVGISNNEFKLNNLAPFNYLEEKICQVDKKTFSFFSYKIDESSTIKREENVDLKILAKFFEIYQHPQDFESEDDVADFLFNIPNKENFFENSKKIISQVNQNQQITFRLLSNFWNISKYYMYPLIQYRFINPYKSKKAFADDKISSTFPKLFVENYQKNAAILVSKNIEWEKKDISLLIFSLEEKKKLIKNVNFISRNPNNRFFHREIQNHVSKYGFKFNEHLKNLRTNEMDNSKALKILSYLSPNLIEIHKKLIFENEYFKNFFTLDNFLRMILILYKLLTNIPIIIKTTNENLNSEFIQFLIENFLNQHLIIYHLNDKSNTKKEIIQTITEAEHFIYKNNIQTSFNILFEGIKFNSINCIALLKQIIFDRISNRSLISDKIRFIVSYSNFNEKQEFPYLDSFINEFEDFGTFNEKIENNFIYSMVSQAFTNLKFPKTNNNQITLIKIIFTTNIINSHKFIQKNLNQTCSLKDISRTLTIFNWLLNPKASQILFYEKEESVRIFYGMVVSLFINYILKLSQTERNKLESEIEKEIASNLNSKKKLTIKSIISDIQNKLINFLELDHYFPQIQITEELKQNLLIIFICYFSHSTLFLYGKSGLSQYIAIKILKEIDSKSGNQIFQKLELPSLKFFNIICSTKTTKKDIQNLFKSDFKSIQENQNNILPVVTLSNTQFLENNSNETYKILNFYLNLNQIYESDFEILSNEEKRKEKIPILIISDSQLKFISTFNGIELNISDNQESQLKENEISDILIPDTKKEEDNDNNDNNELDIPKISTIYLLKNLSFLPIFLKQFPTRMNILFSSQFPDEMKEYLNWKILKIELYASLEDLLFLCNGNEFLEGLCNLLTENYIQIGDNKFAQVTFGLYSKFIQIHSNFKLYSIQDVSIIENVDQSNCSKFIKFENFDLINFNQNEFITKFIDSHSTILDGIKSITKENIDNNNLIINYNDNLFLTLAIKFQDLNKNQPQIIENNNENNKKNDKDYIIFITQLKYWIRLLQIGKLIELNNYLISKT